MIHYNGETRTFNLLLNSSFYAFKISDDGRLVHLDSGPRPTEDAGEPVASGRWSHQDPSHSSHNIQGQTDEVMAFGDYSYQEVGLKVSFPNPPEGGVGPEERANLPMRDTRLRYRRHEIVTDAAPGLSARHGQPTLVTSPRETLRVEMADPAQAFEATLCLRVTPEHDVIERWMELANAGEAPIAVEQCAFGSIHLPTGAYELTHLTGSHCNEFDARREPLAIGSTTLESRRIVTSLQHNPFFLLNRPGQAWEDGGVVYYGMLAYSGNWRLTFEHRGDLTTTVYGGYNPFDFDLTLAPGERHVTPAFIHGCCAEGWGGASRRLHGFIRERVSPRTASAPPSRPVLYNSWEATYFNQSNALQMELARKAAAIGVELFCVDDAWFGARRNAKAGLGDWVVSPEAFADGLEPLVDEVHRLGMRFGLWVEPENVNPDSDLYRAHPDWVMHFPGRPRTEARNQLILDFGRDEVVEHIFDALDALASDYAVDFFKWDMNKSATEVGSAAGKAVWRRHVEALYGLMDRLRARHPGLEIQSCASGGGRVDAGVLARVDQVWTSDNTDALDRVRIQEGFSLAYPARVMECWVTNEENHQTGRRLALALRFDVAMRGALGVGSNIEGLSDEELKEYADHIAFYKRIRAVVQDGACHRLQRLEEHGASVVQYVLPDAAEAVLSIVVVRHQHGQVFPPARLRGLDPSATYALVDRHDKELRRATGRELMAMGLPLRLGPGRLSYGYSRTLHLRAIARPPLT